MRLSTEQPIDINCSGRGHGYGVSWVGPIHIMDTDADVATGERAGTLSR